eukprot:COSAG04_NODE_15034_length_546_cov_0.930649_1_plen_156_part_10
MASARRRTRVLAAHVAAAAEKEEPAVARTIFGEVSARNCLVDGSILPSEPIVHTAADSLPGSFGVELTAAEIEQFKTEGWLVKRNLIPRAELAPFRDAAWGKLESVVPFLDRRAPESWQDPSDRWEATHNSAGERSVSEDGEFSANSEWRWHHIGH